MKEYQLTTEKSIIRMSDLATIPNDSANTDYQEYLAWVAAGNTPEPVSQPTIDEIKQQTNATILTQISDLETQGHRASRAVILALVTGKTSDSTDIQKLQSVETQITTLRTMLQK